MEDELVLKKAGLTDSQAQIYWCLIQNGEQAPSSLAELTGQSRENCYAVAKRLVELNLIEQIGEKKATYRALNPSNLEMLAEKRRKQMSRNEKIVKDNLSSILSVFYANNQLPGARTYEGVEGIKEVYRDILRARQDVYLLRTETDKLITDKNDSKSFLHWYREQLPILGIHTYALAPVTPNALRNQRIGRDKAILMERTWMPADDYTAPVSVMVYGDRVAFVDFEQSIMATVIISPVIAECVRQLLKTMGKYYRKTFKQGQK